MSTLVIVESPAKCKKIEKFLGNGYKCIASYGHFREFKDGLKSIDTENNFHPTYKISPAKMKLMVQSAVATVTPVSTIIQYLSMQ